MNLLGPSEATGGLQTQEQFIENALQEFAAKKVTSTVSTTTSKSTGPKTHTTASSTYTTASNTYTSVTVTGAYANSTTTSKQTSSNQSPGYTIFIDSDGKTKARNDVTGDTEYYGTDAAAVLQRCIDALKSMGGLIILGSGTYVWQSTPALPKDLANWLKIVGEGEVTIQLTANGPRAFDFRKTADYDTFRNVWLENFIIDCNNVGGQHHVVLGTYQHGVVQNRINIENIIIRKIVTKNVPVDATCTNHRRNICLVVYHPSVGERQTMIRNIRIENCDFRGGNAGIEVAGCGPTAVGINIFVDGIYICNCKHTLLFVQTLQFPSANFHVGNRGFGGYAHIVGCYGEYSGDVGVEVNAIDALVENTTIRDAAGVAFYYTNYNNLQNANGQQIAFRNCVAQKMSLPSHLEGIGWAVNSNLSVGLGTLIIDRCAFYSSVSSFRTGEAIRVSSSSGMTGLTINNFKSITDGLSYSALGTNRINPVVIGVTGGTVHATLKNVELIVSGTRQPAAGTLLVAGIDLHGEATIDFQDIRVDLWVTNMQAYSMCGIAVGNIKATIGGTIQRFTVSRIGDDSNPAGIIIRDTTTLMIDGQLLIKECDFSTMTKGNEVRFTGAKTNMDGVYFSNIKWGT